MTKKHNAYQVYAPEEGWTERPRVLTYARRKQWPSRLEKRQDWVPSREIIPDILVLELQGGQVKDTLRIVNIYNAPRGCERAGQAANAVMEIRNLMQGQAIIMEDINLHHTDWDNQTINPLQPANKLADWVTENGALYELFPGTKTHNHRGTIDIVISSARISPNVTECYIEPSLHITSDHETIVTTVELGPEFCKENGKGKFQLRKLDEKQFLAYLESQKDLVKSVLTKAKGVPAQSEIRKTELDRYAEVLSTTIHSSLEQTTQRSKNSGQGEQ